MTTNTLDIRTLIKCLVTDDSHSNLCTLTSLPLRNDCFSNDYQICLTNDWSVHTSPVVQQRQQQLGQESMHHAAPMATMMHGKSDEALHGLIKCHMQSKVQLNTLGDLTPL